MHSAGGSLKKHGIGVGDTVCVMATDLPELLEAVGVGMAGEVLNALNIRLDAETIAFILQHSDCKVLITDREYSGVIAKASTELAISRWSLTSMAHMPKEANG